MAMKLTVGQSERLFRVDANRDDLDVTQLRKVKIPGGTRAGAINGAPPMWFLRKRKVPRDPPYLARMLQPIPRVSSFGHIADDLGKS